MPQEQADVLAALAQRRQVNGKHVQAIEQVVAEAARTHTLLQVDVRRGHNARVHLNQCLTAHPAERKVLEDPKQIDLNGQGGLSQLIEKQRPAICHGKHAVTSVHGAGERAPLMPKQLRLEKGLAEGTAVDRDVGLVTPR